MKKQFLLVSAMMLISAGAFAQWVCPTPQKSALDLDGAEQYFYNVEYAGFLVGANDWGTRASVARDKGLKVTVTPGATEGSYVLGQFSPDNADGVWIDGSRDGNDSFTFAVNEDQTFTIGTTKFEGTFLTWTGAETNTRVNFTESKENGTWYAVSVEDYDAFQALIPQVNAYYTAMELKSAIEAAEEQYPGIDLAAPKAVFANTESTIDELNAAKEAVTEAVKKIVAEEAQKNASVENPVNMTSSIINPTFDNITYEGWEGSKFGSGGTTGPCAERYEMNFDTYQIITGLPNGVYRVTVDGFFRWGSTDNAYKTRGQKTPAYLYGADGKDANDLMKASIMGLFDGMEPDKPVDGCSFTNKQGEDTYYLPNSMKDACIFFDAGYYQPSEENNTVYFGVTDGVARIGVKKDELSGADWTLVDDFTLTYYGNGEDAYTMWNNHVATQMKDYSNLEDEGVIVTEAVVESYNEVKDEVSAPATDHATVVANVAKLEAAEAAIEANIQAWKDLVAEQSLCAQEAGKLYGQDADDLKDYLEGDLQDKINDHELSTEEVLAEIQTLKEMLKKATENGLQPGQEVTSFIINASFKDGFKGWTNSEGKAPVGNVGGIATVCPNVEVFQKPVDVQQTIEGLPKGVYKLECQAFERPSGNGSYTGEEPAKVFLFMNSVETPVQNIAKGAIADEDAINKQNCYNVTDQGTASTGAHPYDYYMEGAGWVPNSMDGASYAFAGGRYVQEAVGLVTDGKMTIGLTSKGVTPEWVLWAGFKLTYVGMGAEDVKPTLDATVASLKTDAYYGSDVKAKVDEAIAAAEAATTGAEMVDALDVLSQLKAQQTASIAKFEKLGALCEESIDAIENDEKYAGASAEAKDAALALVGVAAEGSQGVYTDAEADEALENIAVALAKLVIPANINEATPEKPIDITGVIANPSFEENGVGGWTNSGSITVNAQTNTAFNKTGNTYAERWHVAGTMDLSQVISGKLELPAGYYTLTADVYSGIDDATIYMNGEEVVYGNTNSNAETDRVEATVSVYVPEATDIKIGVKGTLTASTWFCVDNFRLVYNGNQGDPTAVENVQTKNVASAIYGINGVQAATLRKGINIVRTSEGKVVKVLVK